MIHTYEYAVIGGDERFEFNSKFLTSAPEWLAEDAAEDFFNNHDGWESSWPVAFEIYAGDEKVGLFSVDMEHVPRFSALRLVV